MWFNNNARSTHPHTHTKAHLNTTQLHLQWHVVELGYHKAQLRAAANVLHDCGERLGVQTLRQRDWRRCCGVQRADEARRGGVVAVGATRRRVRVLNAKRHALADSKLAHKFTRWPCKRLVWRHDACQRTEPNRKPPPPRVPRAAAHLVL